MARLWLFISAKDLNSFLMSRSTNTPSSESLVRSQGEGKYRVVIVVVAVVAILLGALIGYVLSVNSSQQRVTLTHRTVTADGFRPVAIQFFDPSDSKVGNLSSAVGIGSHPNAYQLYLVSGKFYGIQVFYNGTSPTTTRCFPGTFTPSGVNETQDFAC